MNSYLILADMPSILIPIVLVAVFGLIVLVVILIKRHVKIFKNDEKPKSDKEIAAEELDRLLQPVEELEPAKEEEEVETKDENGAPKA